MSLSRFFFPCCDLCLEKRTEFPEPKGCSSFLACLLLPCCYPCLLMCNDCKSEAYTYEIEKRKKDEEIKKIVERIKLNPSVNFPKSYDLRFCRICRDGFNAKLPEENQMTCCYGHTCIRKNCYQPRFNGSNFCQYHSQQEASRV